ncbi:LPS translocon maturation chaperone LptM [Oryzicola mucosus]|uniref:Lipoprotein n=1 Tax=Oryzicola mucosus TaxID=2767425 RepID=A0A8J6PW43_9HYPH|nr:lipoprotein [Oryzicola mucosus]MBD0417284.1 lipoprotein [Oryzicola mucosus]
MTAGKLLGTAAMVAALALVSACGRKGPLDTPYEAGIQARKDARSAGQPLPPEPKPPVVDKPFILDPLI